MFLISACNRKEIIPEKDLVAILAKIQIIDASVQHNIYNQTLLNRDTIDYYSKTIQSFGYTKEQFDSTIGYYSRNPKAFDIIYDKVIAELSRIDTEISKNIALSTDSINSDTLNNLWKLKLLYEFPIDDSLGAIDFYIPVKGLGTYTISTNARIFEDDSTLKPSIEAFFFFDDKSKEGNKSSFTSVPYSKGKDTLAYSLQLDLKNTLVTHIKGSLFAHANSKIKVKKHAIFKNIKISFKAQEPLRKRIRPNRQRKDQIETSLR